MIELSGRESMFKKLHVGTVSLALLSGNYVVLNANRKGQQNSLLVDTLLFSWIKLMLYPTRATEPIY